MTERTISSSISALKFLIEPVQPRNTTRPYQFPARTTLTNFLKREYLRLYPAIADEEPEEEASPTSTSPTDMTAAFQEFMTAEKRAAPTPSSNLWSKRVELFTNTEERPPCLELLHSALFTVPPTYPRPHFTQAGDTSDKSDEKATKKRRKSDQKATKRDRIVTK